MMLAGCGTSGAASASSAAGGPAGASWDSPGRAHIVAVFQNHCGSCHRLVRPGIETSAVLEATLVRHRKRTRLTEDEWAGLGQFLAARP
jgi:mono/diheme cytochrome c family protein